jgi:hypothetical protein
MSRKVKSRNAPKRMLPTRALQLIREYSKPITRGDWRTFPRILNNIYIKGMVPLWTNIKTRPLYYLVHRNKHNYLYSMSKEDLFWLVNDQFQVMKCHTIIPLFNMTKLQLIHVEIWNELIMRRPGYRQKKFFKNNPKLMKGYVKNKKLKNGNTYNKATLSRPFKED